MSTPQIRIKERKPLPGEVVIRFSWKNPPPPRPRPNPSLQFEVRERQLFSDPRAFKISAQANHL